MAKKRDWRPEMVKKREESAGVATGPRIADKPKDSNQK